jgi:hypothetical protein
MSNFRQTLRESEEYKQITGETTRDPAETRRVSEPSETVAPVVSLEKSDLLFWMQVAEVVILFLILRELGGVA